MIDRGTYFIAQVRFSTLIIVTVVRQTRPGCLLGVVY